MQRSIAQTLIILCQKLIRHPQSFHHTRGEILDKNVGFCAQRPQYRRIFGRLEIEDHTLLSSVHALEVPSEVTQFVVGQVLTGCPGQVAGR